MIALALAKGGYICFSASHLIVPSPCLAYITVKSCVKVSRSGWCECCIEHTICSVCQVVVCQFKKCHINLLHTYTHITYMFCIYAVGFVSMHGRQDAEMLLPQTLQEAGRMLTRNLRSVVDQLRSVPVKTAKVKSMVYKNT